MKLHKLDLLPLIIIITYIIIGVTLSFWGPVEYLNYNKLEVGIYIFFFLLLFSSGYILGLITDKATPVKKDFLQELQKKKKVLFWVKTSLLVIATVQFTTLITGILNGTLNLSIANMGHAYINAYTDYERGTGNISITFVVQTLTYVFYLTSLILGAFYYKDLPKRYRLMTIFIYISIILIETIGHGKQKQLGDILIFLSLVSLYKNNLFNKRIKRKILRKLYLLSSLGIVLLVTVLYFRYSALGVNAENINDKTLSVMVFDTDHVVFKIFGEEVGFPLASFSTYLSQGYYGLSLSMQEPFVWTYFVGNSYSLTVFLNRFFGIPVDFHDTYPYRTSLHTIWDDSKWSTAFVWFAGDFTFYGTLILFMCIAYFYAKLWIEVYKYKNPISMVLFSMLTIALLYIPANNQLMHTPGSVIALFLYIFIWIFKHRKYNSYTQYLSNIENK